MFGTRVFVGLDIGHYSVKVAVLGTNKKQILDLSETEILPERAFQEDGYDEARVVERVKSAFAPITDAKSKYKASVSASFQNEGAVCRYLELPPLKKEQMETAITSAASKLLTFPLQEAFITHIPVPAMAKSSQNGGVFLLAFPKIPMEKHRALLARCGFELERMEVSLVPLLRAFTANHGKFPGELVALVQAGSRLTTVIVLRDGYPYFARDFALGGSTFTYAFQMGAQSTWEDAERYKRGYDVAAKEIPIEPVLARWLDQVKRSLDGFVKSNKELAPQVQRVFLTGGSAAWKSFAPRLEEHLKIPVTAESWEQLAPQGVLRDMAPGTFSTALGLALG